MCEDERRGDTAALGAATHIRRGRADHSLPPAAVPTQVCSCLGGRFPACHSPPPLAAVPIAAVPTSALALSRQFPR